MDYTLTQEPSPAEIQFIKDRIKQYNDSVSASHRARRREPDSNLCVFLRDEHAAIQGGVTAKLYWNWLYVDELWVSEELRGQGHGRHMLGQVEQAGIERGVKNAQVFTWSFQALGFYQKQGYRTAGQMEDYPPGETFYWLHKELT